MAWVKEQKWLLAGTESGLIGWKLPTKVLTGAETAKPSMIDFELGPDSEFEKYGQIVDSVCSLGQGGRSCAGARVAPAEKFGLGRKF